MALMIATPVYFLSTTYPHRKPRPKLLDLAFIVSKLALIFYLICSFASWQLGKLSKCLSTNVPLEHSYEDNEKYW
jgi:hypothetical protein